MFDSGPEVPGVRFQSLPTHDSTEVDALFFRTLGNLPETRGYPFSTF